VIDALSFCFEYNRDTSAYEEFFRQHFASFGSDDFVDRVLNFPLPFLSRSLQNVSEDDHSQEFNVVYAFLVRCLDKYGADASVLFREFPIHLLSSDQLCDLCGREDFCWSSLWDVFSTILMKIKQIQETAQSNSEKIKEELRQEACRQTTRSEEVRRLSEEVRAKESQLDESRQETTAKTAEVERLEAELKQTKEELATIK
jgi:hypothetical protein